MATSNSFSYQDSAGQLIADVAAAQGFTTEGEELTDYEYQFYQRQLNRLFKSFMVKNSQHVGVHIWQRHIGYMFLSPNTSNYQLSANSAYWTDSFLQGFAKGANPATQNVLSIQSTSAIAFPSNTAAANGIVSVGMHVALEMDNNTMFYANVKSVVNSTAVVLDSLLPTSANNGGVAYFFLRNAQPPQSIEHVTLRDQGGNDLTLDILTKDQWSDFPGKAQPGFAGDPQAVYYEPHLVDNAFGTGFYGDLHTDVATAIDVTKFLVIDYIQELQDINNSSNMLDCPKEFYLALFWMLAKDTIDFAQENWTQSMESNYQMAVKLAGNSNPKRTAARFVRRGYGGAWRQIPHR